MPKKKKKQEEGAPAWMLTYGDMMTLLLCFFVLIVSFSEIKKEDMWQAVVEEIKTAFGMKGGGGKLPTKDDPALSFIERIEAMRLEHHQIPKRSNVDDPGIEGREREVTTVRKGMLFVVGGRVYFEPGSADLTDTAKGQLRTAAELIRGRNQVVEIRGHTARGELGHTSAYSDLRDLSLARAEAVEEFLASNEVGLRRDRFRLMAVADREPLEPRGYRSSEQVSNRRVEVFETEVLVRQMKQPELDH
jgi:chemotaxis protein MotB